MSKTQTELEKVILLQGTFLMEVNKEESKSKSGLVVSASRSQKTAKIVARNRLNSDGEAAEYNVGDKILLNPNYDSIVVELDGKKYELGTRQNIHLILERE